MQRKNINQLFEKASELPVDERRALAGMIQSSIEMFQKHYTVSQRYDILLQFAEKTWGHKLYWTRTREDTQIRMFIAYKMRLEGYTFAEIGKSMKRSHASILNLVARMNDVFDLPRVYADENQKYKEFEESVNQFDREQNQQADGQQEN